jgi:hypothetical protein
VVIDVSEEGKRVCRYMELLNNYNVSVDVLLEHYWTFDANALSMFELFKHTDFIKQEISIEGENFSVSNVLGQALRFKLKLKEILESPLKYMFDLIRDKERHNPIYFSIIPMSDPVVAECEAHPHEMAIAIMGGKAADALMFIPNMLEWSSKFPEMKGIVSDLVEIAKEAKKLVEEELVKMPSEAEQEDHPLFFTWWHLDHVNFQLEYNLENVQL